MVKFNEVKLFYTCPAFPPDGIDMSKIYTIEKDNNGFYFTDGNYIKYVKDDELWYIKMLFTPQNVSWEVVDFSDEIKNIVNVTTKIEEIKK